MEGFETKRCSRCGDIKAISQFRREPRNRDGRKGQCRACSNARDRTRAQEKKRLEANGHPKRSGRLSELIAAVDTWKGNPSDAAIARLAVRYGDTEFMVRHLFEYRAYRLQVRRKAGER